MGKRARANGIANAVVRAARAVDRDHDEQCALIARRVYRTGVEIRQAGVTDAHLPPSVFVPLTAAAEAAAPGACRLAGLDVTEANADLVTAYLMAGFKELVVMLDRDHFDRWRAAGEDGGPRATEDHEEGVHRADDDDGGAVV